jgi:hypothetical protein
MVAWYLWIYEIEFAFGLSGYIETGLLFIPPNVRKHVKMSKPRFHVSSFGGNITVQMNEAFACELFDLVRKEPGVSPTLFALSEKIENQFYFMGKLTQRPGRVEAEVETGVVEQEAAEQAA